MNEEIETIEPNLDEEQVQQDVQVMEAGLDAPAPEPIKGTEMASLSSKFAKQIAEKALKGEQEFQARQAAKIEDDVVKKSRLLKETKLEDLDPEEPYQINFDTIMDADDVRKEFGVLNEFNKEAIQTQRREVVPDEELKSLANNLSSDPETIKKVLGLKPGEILAPEYILSMKQVLKQSAMRLRELSQKIVGHEATDKDKLDFHKQWEFHSQYTKQFMGVRAEYGRGLRALGLQQSEQRDDLTVLMDRMSAGNMDELTMAQQISMAGDIQSITSVVRDQSEGIFSKAGNFFSELYISSILSGPQTHIVNTVSSAMRTISMPLDTAVASLFKADGANIVQKGEGMAQLKGMIESHSEALQTAFKVLKTGEPYGGSSKVDVDFVKAISANALGIKEGALASTIDYTGKFVRFPTDNLMGAEDAYFKVLNERGALRQIAHRKAVEQHLEGEEYDNFIVYFMNNPSVEALTAAREAGLRGTFQQELGRAGKKVQTLRNELWGGKFIMPFVKTPINLIYEGFVERTPLGLLSKKYKESLQMGGEAAQMAKAKMAIGTSINSTLLMTFYGLEYGSEDSKVELIGSYPSDFKLAQSMKDAGIQENSIAVTNEDGKKEYISFDRLEPFNSILKLYANIMQVQKVANLNDLNPDLEKEYAKIAAGMTLAFSEATVNQTFMRGIKDLMQALEAGTNVKKIESLAANYANAFVPYSATLRSITRTFDEQVKDADGILEKIKRNMPYLGKDNPPVLDNYGKPVVFENNLTPAYMKMLKDGSKDMVRNEVYRVTQITKSVPVFKPKKTIGGYKLNAQQYYDYINFATNDKIDGKTFYQDLKSVIASKEYKRSSDYEKAILLRESRDFYYTEAKYKLFDKYPEIEKYDMDKKEFIDKLIEGDIK